MPERITPRSIALTILGTVIGAGFASGQEISHFFVRHGPTAGWTILVSTICFLLLMLLLTRVSLSSEQSSFSGLLEVMGGKRVAPVFRHIFAAFLFIGLTVMIAGSAALIAGLLFIPKLVVGVITALVVYLVCRRQAQGLSRANDLLMPCFLFLLLFYFLCSLPLPAVPAPITSTGQASWFWSGLLYAALNSATLLVVIPPLVTKTSSPKAAYSGVVAAVTLLSLLLYLVVFLLCKFQGVAQGDEMPLLAVSSHLLPSLPFLYAIPLWIALATTAFADGLGLKVYLQEHLPRQSEWPFTALLALAAVLSQLNFSTLVAHLYPLIGYACLGFYLFCSGRWLVLNSFDSQRRLR